MSMWTSVYGVITVEVWEGSGQRAKDFIIGSIIDHLPHVTGSEYDMHIEIIRRPRHNSVSNVDEFGQFSRLGNGWYDTSFEEQSVYELMLTGDLRDREFDETLREFVKMMNRLSQRVDVRDMMVRVDGYCKHQLFTNPGCWRGKEKRNKKKSSEIRHWCNWRYATGPTLDNETGGWTENLVTCLPGGYDMAFEKDYINGNLEWYEYEHTGGYDTYVKETDKIIERIMLSRKNYKTILEAQDEG